MNPFGKRRAVAATPDLQRIRDLPRRDPMDGVDELVPLLTDYLRTPEGTQTLRPIQAAALRDCHDHRGLFGPIEVGEGKTLVSLLAPSLIPCERPLLLTKAALVQKTLKEGEELKRHWKIRSDIRVASYNKISTQPGFLEDMAPDLIVADEVHALGNLKSGRTRRVKRYMQEHEPAFVGLSASVLKRSMRDYWHLLIWALRFGAPVPYSWREAQEWADALDPDVDSFARLDPGPLVDLVATEKDRPENYKTLPLQETTEKTVRSAFRRRLTETPGVVASSGPSLVRASLRLEDLGLQLPAVCKGYLDRLRDSWETPDGIPLDSPSDVWQVARCLSLGFHYRWEPEPPREWLEARRVWGAWVRHRLATNRFGLDTAGQVAEEASGTEGPDPAGWGAWENWKLVQEHTGYTYDVVPVWHDNTIPWAVWEKAVEFGAIVWTDLKAFGEALGSEEVPWFGGGAEGLEDHKGPCVASINAHGEGRNLQQFSRAIVVTPPGAGRTWEQLLGRHHRPGQEADEVVFHVAQHTDVFREAFGTACRDARYIQETVGNRQKLTYCDIAFPVVGDV